MDLDFMRDQSLALQTLDIISKPKFNLMRQNLELEEDRKFMILMVICLFMVLVMVLIK